MKISNNVQKGKKKVKNIYQFYILLINYFIIEIWKNMLTAELPEF